MANYTIELRELVENNYPIFDFSYPLFDESYRETFERKVKAYRIEHKIGQEEAQLRGGAYR